MSLLELRHVSKSFKHAKGSLRVLEDINFSVEEGEFIAIVGPSGCGKSTMLRIMNGLIAPSAGQVRPGAGGRAARAADGRAVLRARRTDGNYLAGGIA